MWCIILLEKGKHCGVFGGEGCIVTHICSRVGVCLQSFVTKFGIVVHYHVPECHAKKWDSIFKVKVTMLAYIIKI